MKVTSYYPVLEVQDVAEAAVFFRRHFGFAPAFESDWYVHLTQPEQSEVNLAILQSGHPTIPRSEPRCASGVLINFEVEDAAAEWERLSQSDLCVRLPLRDEAFGQRHFILQGPEGVLIDVIQPIPPSPEFAEMYAESALPTG